MDTLSLNEVKLAVKIGDHSKSLSVVGKTTEETRQNLFKLFSTKNDKKKISDQITSFRGNNL